MAAYENTKDAAAIALMFGVSESSVYRLVNQKRKTDSLALNTSLRGQKSPLTLLMREQIKQKIAQVPDITLQELIDELNLPVKVPALSMFLNHKMGYSKKNYSCFLTKSSGCSPTTQRLGRIYQRNRCRPLVFIDESGVNIGLTRTYGRSIGKERVRDDVAFNRPVRTTIVSSIRWNGEYASQIIEGVLNFKQFKIYVETVLCPKLKVGGRHCRYV